LEFTIQIYCFKLSTPS